MALIKCSECGKEISDKATNCPNCGCPIEKETRKVVIKRNNFAAALKAYIRVDNVDIGSIRVNKDITIDLPLGKHTINVNTVGLKGESTAVDGTQIEITSDMEVINILVGGKYSLTTEIAGMSQV